jgi:hypothetical protein
MPVTEVAQLLVDLDQRVQKRERQTKKRLVAIEHDEKSGGRWKFQRWELVDLSHFRVRLKAEFQGSNRDMYQPGAIVGTSQK